MPQRFVCWLPFLFARVCCALFFCGFCFTLCASPLDKVDISKDGFCDCDFEQCKCWNACGEIAENEVVLYFKNGTRMKGIYVFSADGRNIGETKTTKPVDSDTPDFSFNTWFRVNAVSDGIRPWKKITDSKWELVYDKMELHQIFKKYQNKNGGLIDYAYSGYIGRPCERYVYLLFSDKLNLQKDEWFTVFDYGVVKGRTVKSKTAPKKWPNVYFETGNPDETQFGEYNWYQITGFMAKNTNNVVKISNLPWVFSVFKQPGHAVEKHKELRALLYKPIVKAAKICNRKTDIQKDSDFSSANFASDLITGVVFGSIGGVISGVVIKKKQIEKAFETLYCTPENTVNLF